MCWNAVERFKWWPAGFFGFFVFAPFLIAAVVGAVALGLYVAQAVGGLGRTYDLGATKACIERRGRPVRVYRDVENFRTLEVGPFQPRRLPKAAFTFAPTPKVAKSFNEDQSVLDERIGNVVVRGGSESEVAIAKRCLRAKASA